MSTLNYTNYVSKQREDAVEAHIIVLTDISIEWVI